MISPTYLISSIFRSIITIAALFGIISIDYVFRHEIVRKTTRELNKENININHISAINASKNNNFNLLNKLKIVGVNLSYQDSLGNTPLSYAIKNENIPIITYLLEDKYVIKNFNKYSPYLLSLALEIRNFDIADKLLQEGANINVVNKDKIPYLILSIKNKDEKLINYLLKNKCDPNFTGEIPNIMPALAIAFSQNDITLAEKLLTLGANPNIIGNFKKYIIIDAIENNKKEFVDILIKYKANLNKDVKGKPYDVSPLSISISQNDIITSHKLLKSKANPNVKGKSGEYLLIEAIKTKNFFLVELLLKYGANPDIVSSSKSKNNLPLNFAIKLKEEKIIDLLLSYNASIKINGFSGNPILFDLLSDNNLPVLNKLLNKGANVSQIFKKKSLLFYAVELENLNAIKLLLKHGANPSLSIKNGSTSPILKSLELKNSNIFDQLYLNNNKNNESKLLIEAYKLKNIPMITSILGITKNNSNEFKNTIQYLFNLAVKDNYYDAVMALRLFVQNKKNSLWEALQSNNHKIINLILETGEDPNGVTPENKPYIEYALENEFYDSANVLFKNGVDPNIVNSENDPWIHQFIRKKNSDIAITLIEKGVNLYNNKFSKKHTLLGWAIANEMENVVEALLKAGVNPNESEPYPARLKFIEQFKNSRFRHALRRDRNIKPIMLAAANKNYNIALQLIKYGANRRYTTPGYMNAQIIGAWTNDIRMQQISITGNYIKNISDQPRKVVIDISDQRTYLYEKGKSRYTYSARCSTGKKGHRTPTGKFVISQKSKDHKSNLYDDSPMPFFLRFSNSAIGLHQGILPGYPASHGCIRLSYEDAKYFFYKLNLGDYVVIRN